MNPTRAIRVHGVSLHTLNRPLSKTRVLYVIINTSRRIVHVNKAKMATQYSFRAHVTPLTRRQRFRPSKQGKRVTSMVPTIRFNRNRFLHKIRLQLRHRNVQFYLFLGNDIRNLLRLTRRLLQNLIYAKYVPLIVNRRNYYHGSRRHTRRRARSSSFLSRDGISFLFHNEFRPFRCVHG